MPDDDERHDLEILSPTECLRLLEKGRIGRVGFISDGQPHVLPVNYLASDAGEVVFRTTDGSVLTAVARGPAAVGPITGSDRWAVVRAQGAIGALNAGEAPARRARGTARGVRPVG